MTPSDASAPDGERAVNTLRDAWVAAVAAGDARSLGDLVTPDYEVWAHGMPTSGGPGAGRWRYARGMTNGLPPAAAPTPH